MASLTTLFAFPATARAQESDGLAVEIRGVSTVAPLKPGERPLRVYRALLPKGIEPAADPIVGVWLAELHVPKETPGRPQDEAAHWLEGAIELRVRYGEEEEGWYQIHYPVTAEFWFEAGRAVGLPKRHAEATITPDGAGWRAQSIATGVDGPPAFVMAWQPASEVDPAAVDLAFRAGTDPFFALNEPLKGPDLMRIDYKINPPYPFQTALPGAAPAYSAETAKPDPGWVDLQMRRDIDDINEDLPDIFPLDAHLGDVVDLEQRVPGAHYFYSLSLNSESATVGESSYPPRSKVSREPRRRCERRIRKLRLPMRPGERVKRVRARAGNNRVPARRIGRRRVRLNLRGLPNGRHRLRIRAKTTDGRVVKVTRRVRLCAARA